ncbi:heterokaryon incompatibility protein-domain-containing protein [Xylaria acuta]|nr:heterokaryon incompatibility protein-domain-containing protein [Xylaria acuta]
MLGPFSSKLDASCDICGCLSREPLYERGVIARATFPAFADRAIRGCIFCALICNTAVARSSSWSSVAQDKLLINIRVSDPHSSKELRVTGYEPLRPCRLDQADFVGNSWSLFSTCLYSPLESPSHIERIPTLPHITQDPLSGSAREMLRDWLESCDEHQDCRSSGVKLLPKKLVDVGDGDDTTVKITSATEGHSYLALSHCWGSGKMPFSTTKANEASLRVAIPWAALPQSFQDAIRVTRWLSARYIWIDSLCIVQDDKQDWEEESAKMAGIFSGCYLAIAASRASSCDEGFLQVRREGQLIMSGTHQGIPLVVFTRYGAGHKSSLGNVPYPFWELPLFNRGWCFQERLLAPRTLHFARDELFFQCRTEDRCECGGRSPWNPAKGLCHAYYAATVSWDSRQICAFEGQERRHLDADSDNDDEASSLSTGESITIESFPENNATALVRRLYDVPAGITEDQEIPIRFGQLWGDIVSDYASLNLTFQRDMLPALSGIANLMLAYYPGRYFAGLWELDIHYLLGWHSARNDGRCYRPQEATAPSFSWASRSGPVGFPFECLMTSVCRVLDIRCEAKGADPYGQVLPGGYVALQGKLISGTVKSNLSRTGWSYSVAVWDARGEEYSAYLEFDTEEDEKDLGQGTESVVSCFELFRGPGWEDQTDKEADNHRVTGIILKEDDGCKTFRRAGIAFHMPALAFNAVLDITVRII